MDEIIFKKYQNRFLKNCTIECYLKVLQIFKKNEEDESSEKWRNNMAKKIFWHFIEEEFFSENNYQKVVQNLENVINPISSYFLFLYEKIKKNYLDDDEKKKLLMKLMNNIGLLNTLKQKIIKKIKNTEKLLQKKKIIQYEDKLKKTLEEENYNRRIVSCENFQEKFFSKFFFEKYNRIFCQICNRVENLSDDDYYIFCEICNILVHKTCYDLEEMPKKCEFWFCDPCFENIKFFKKKLHISISHFFFVNNERKVIEVKNLERLSKDMNSLEIQNKKKKH